MVSGFAGSHAPACYKSAEKQCKKLLYLPCSVLFLYFVLVLYLVVLTLLCDIFHLLPIVPPDPPLIRVPLRYKCGRVYRTRDCPVTIFQAVWLQPVPQVESIVYSDRKRLARLRMDAANRVATGYDRRTDAESHRDESGRSQSGLEVTFADKYRRARGR
jgi:hypothetical protein